MKIDNDWTVDTSVVFSGKKVLVVNPHPYPVHLTSDGRMLGGHTNAIVFEEDESVGLALTAKAVVKVYDIEGEEMSFVYQPKRKTRTKKQ